MTSGFNLGLNHHLDLPDDVFRLMRDAIYARSRVITFSQSSGLAWGALASTPSSASPAVLSRWLWQVTQ